MTGLMIQTQVVGGTIRGYLLLLFCCSDVEARIYRSVIKKYPIYVSGNSDRIVPRFGSRFCVCLCLPSIDGMKAMKLWNTSLLYKKLETKTVTYYKVN